MVRHRPAGLDRSPFSPDYRQMQRIGDSSSAKLHLLRSMKFGQRVAEDESKDLATYFVETDQWRRIFEGEIDIVYGAKGAGKSALYSLLISRRAELAARGVIVVAGENPQGAPAFQDLAVDPPASEPEFTFLWKLYFLSLIGTFLYEHNVQSAAGTEVLDVLIDAGLLKTNATLRSILKAVADYALSAFRAPKSVEAGIKLDPHTALPVGIVGKIAFREPDSESASRGAISVDHLFDKASQALGASGSTVWLLLDRLDVAFAQTHELEERALRALFKAYLDLLPSNNIRLKIFLRTDIWRRITSSGFREASHITKTATIHWDERSLLNLVVRRILQNADVIKYYDVDAEAVLASTDRQQEFFYRIFPEQVEAGQRQRDTLEWVLSRTSDATRQTAPRELIHFLNAARDAQSHALELGAAAPEETILFSRSSLKDALPEVSKARLEQTLYAEYPDVRERLEALRDEKTKQAPTSLARIWKVETPEAIRLANELVELGFFERQGSKEQPEF
jgi:hypothetical protein